MSARELTGSPGHSRPGFERRPQDPAAGDITVTGASMIEWTPGQAAFEVAQANPGLCAVLENAALLYASGQAAPARTVLEQGVEADHDARLSPLAWLALFDLLQRAGDRAAFDQLALKYVVQFERSAPAWDERAKPLAGPRAGGGYVGITGKLTAATAPQFEGMKRAMARPGAEVRVDLMSITGFDDDGARLFADALADARRRKNVLLLQRAEKLKPMLEAAVRKGKDGGAAAWLLSLEMMQWTNNRTAFEDRAVEYAVTFELSPPSWEPPELPQPAADAPVEGAVDDAQHAAAAVGDHPVWTGAMTGSLSPQLAKLAEFALGHAVIPIDMAQVERVDFVCAGNLLNTINRIETQRKSVQILGATPIVRALLLLIGISPRHFVKKAQ
ncbi:MAG: STAS domain-containing protein [Betaproteobacteria bacterium]